MCPQHTELQDHRHTNRKLHTALISTSTAHSPPAMRPRTPPRVGVPTPPRARIHESTPPPRIRELSSPQPTASLPSEGKTAPSTQQKEVDLVPVGISQISSKIRIALPSYQRERAALQPGGYGRPDIKLLPDPREQEVLFDCPLVFFA